MSRGYVYVLTNPAMPGLVKIGKTTRSVEGRAQELYQTGVPVPFEVAHSVHSPDCAKLEADIHGCLPDLRVNGSREFFNMPVSDAVDFVNHMLHEQLNEWIAEFAEGFRLIEEPLIPELDRLESTANALGAHMFEVISAIGCLTADELAPALQRWRDVAARRREEWSKRETQLRVVGE
jgi:hypothetical protein